jgi:hypothetical protein
MFSDQSPFFSDYQVELTLVWANLEHFGEHFYKVINPLRSHLNEQQTLLGYSLSAFLSSPSVVSFWVEWVFQYSNLSDKQNILLSLNQKIISGSAYSNLIDQQHTTELAQKHTNLQLQWMESQIWETRNLIILKYPYLQQFIENDFWVLHLSSKAYLMEAFRYDDFKVSDFIQKLSYSKGFLQISLPIILGIAFSLNQSHSQVKIEAIPWKNLKSILDQISAIYAMTNNDSSSNLELASQMHFQKLNQDERVAWLNQEQQYRNETVLNNQAIMETIDNLVEQYKKNALLDIENLVFPDKYKEFLFEVVNWLKN